jgi:hypothetical protein
VLALDSPHQYFINYASGSYNFVLPVEWNNVVTQISEESLTATMQNVLLLLSSYSRKYVIDGMRYTEYESI